jgi:hypothetical protein
MAIVLMEAALMAIVRMARDPTTHARTAIVRMSIVRTEAAQMERDPMAIDRMEEGLMA